MGIFSALFGRRRSVMHGDGGFRKQRKRTDDDAQRGEIQLEKVRRWDASTIHTLTTKELLLTPSPQINADISARLVQMRANCYRELANDPMLEGVVDTYVGQVVGKCGPMIDVTCEPHAGYEPGDEELKQWDRWSSALEGIVQEWFDDCDIAGELPFADLMSTAVRHLFPDGEFFVQLVDAGDGVDVSRDRKPSLRLNLVHPQRVETPAGMSDDNGMFMGIQHDKNGRPQRYHIRDEEPGSNTGYSDKFTPVDAQYIVHFYKKLEAGQKRGVPWLAVALPTSSDICEYDEAVLKAAKKCAKDGIYWYSDHPDIEALQLEGGETREIRSDQETVGPPGWRPMLLDPKQPSQMYVEFRKERHRDLGRPFGMTIQMIRLSSDGSNFSSARFDSQIGHKNPEKTQYGLEKRFVNKCIAIIRRQSQLGGLLPPEPRNCRISYNCTWPQPPQPDPEKVAKSNRLKLEDGSMMFEQACAMEGNTVDRVIASRRRNLSKFEAVGLTPPGWLTGEVKQIQPQNGKDNGDDDEKNADDGEEK